MILVLLVSPNQCPFQAREKRDSRPNALDIGPRREKLGKTGLSREIGMLCSVAAGGGQSPLST